VVSSCALARKRSHLSVGCECITDFQRLDPGGQRLHEFVVDILRDDDAARGRATLTGAEERAIECALDGAIEVAVIEHDQRILAAHLELHARIV
jgi:hypothetical protein